MKQKRADAGGRPWSLQPELVEGCTMQFGSGPGGLCHFCGLAALRDGPGDYRFMSVDLATRLAANAGAFCPHARVEFAMRGEPLMNPKHLEIFKIFREAMPQTSLMVTTNGDTIRTPPGRPFKRMQERVALIFAAGINLIVLDTYYPKERRDALRAEAFALSNVTVVDYYDDWAPQGRSPYSSTQAYQTIVLMDDLAVRDGERRTRIVKTHAGSNPTKCAPFIPLSRNCGRPFREITVAWNGDVTLCCDDWKHEYVCGNVAEQSLEEIWVSPLFEAARARLYHRDRDFGPCRMCDASAAPRSGLLPIYDKPTPEQLAMTDRMSTRDVSYVPLKNLKAVAGR